MKWTYHAHDISWLLFWKEASAGVDDFAVCVLLFTTRQASNGYAWSVSGDHFGGACPSQAQVEASLDDAEEVLRGGILVRLYAAVKPAYGALHGLLHAGQVGRGGCDDIVELHDDVGADGVLEGDGVLRREQHGRAIVGTEEAHALFRHFGQLEQRHHLEAGGVSAAARRPTTGEHHAPATVCSRQHRCAAMGVKGKRHL